MSNRQIMYEEAAEALATHLGRNDKPNGKQYCPFYLGQAVQVYDATDDTNRRSRRKLKVNWSGPYIITRLSRSSAHLATPDGEAIGRPVGFERLREYRGVSKLLRDNEFDGMVEPLIGEVA